jgi:hypothetical protein
MPQAGQNSLQVNVAPALEQAFDSYRKIRDAAREQLFSMLYDRE